MVELVSDVGVELITAAASDDMVAMAAWVSNDADSAERLADKDKVKGLINFLYRNKHMSPFEHGHFTFKVDVPLFVAREFHRHRTASYNEVSGRYTEMRPRFYAGDVARVQQGKMGNYYFVDGDNEQTALYRQKKQKGLETRWQDYQDLLAAGIAKEQSREDLPLSMMTQFYVTMNPRNLMQFLTLRNDSHALKEIRDVAVKMEAIFAEHMPLTYSAYRLDRDLKPASREELEGEIKALRGKIANLELNHLSLKEARSQSFESMIEAHQDRDEALKVRDEAVDRYNREFVTAKEAEKEAVENKNYQRGPEWEQKAEKDFNFINEVVPRVGRLVENAAPIYNVYVNLKDNVDGEELADKVAKVLKKMNDRRANTRL